MDGGFVGGEVRTVESAEMLGELVPEFAGVAGEVDDAEPGQESAGLVVGEYRGDGEAPALGGVKGWAVQCTGMGDGGCAGRASCRSRHSLERRSVRRSWLRSTESSSSTRRSRRIDAASEATTWACKASARRDAAERSASMAAMC